MSSKIKPYHRKIYKDMATNYNINIRLASKISKDERIPKQDLTPWDQKTNVTTTVMVFFTWKKLGRPIYTI